MQGQGRLESWRNGKQMACRIVDGDSFEMFAFGIPLDEAVQASLLASAKFALDALLEAIGQDLGAAREIVA